MPRDRFFWLGQINKASAVINVDEGLLDRRLAARIGRGLVEVLENGNKPNGSRPGLVIKFEPLLIKSAGIEATRLHIGRSSQDMHATATTAIIRDETLDLAYQLHDTALQLTGLADEHIETLVPNYTNGVAAQPNSYGHYLLGHIAGLLRDAERLRQFYERLDRCPMGSTVLNGTSWPLNRKSMAAHLGFSAVVDNAYDAVQITGSELPVELGYLCTSMMLHAGAYIQDVMVQYAQPRPWIVLKEGNDNTYVSSAMPQKRNPGLLNSTRAEASRVISLGVGRAIQAHNIPPGMNDARSTNDNVAILRGARCVLQDWSRILRALAINGARASEELNSDWTASQEIADVLMRRYDIPFRMGHHFVSEIVTYAREHGICPADFPYTQAQRIWIETCSKMAYTGTMALPLTEIEFRDTLDPAAIVRNRTTTGGCQPVEVRRMIQDAEKTLEGLFTWVTERRALIDSSLARLEKNFRDTAGLADE